MGGFRVEELSFVFEIKAQSFRVVGQELIFEMVH
jgi:hypothetical protein